MFRLLSVTVTGRPNNDETIIRPIFKAKRIITDSASIKKKKKKKPRHLQSLNLKKKKDMKVNPKHRSSI